MLLTHTLPPQFLLPSWSASELAQAVQRACYSGSSRRRSDKDVRDAIRKAATGSSYWGRTRLRTQSIPQPGLETTHKDRRSAGTPRPPEPTLSSSLMTFTPRSDGSTLRSANSMPRKGYTPSDGSPVPIRKFAGVRFRKFTGIPKEYNTGRGIPTIDGGSVRITKYTTSPQLQRTDGDGRSRVENSFKPSRSIQLSRTLQTRENLRAQSPDLIMSASVNHESRALPMPLGAFHVGKQYSGPQNLTSGKQTTAKTVHTMKYENVNDLRGKMALVDAPVDDAGSSNPVQKSLPDTTKHRQRRRQRSRQSGAGKSKVIEHFQTMEEVPLTTQQNRPQLSHSKQDASLVRKRGAPDHVVAPRSSTAGSDESGFSSLISEPSRPESVKQVPERAEPEREPLSLFDELFPEMSRAQYAARKEAEQRLDRLPAFNWKPEQVGVDMEEQRRQERKAKLHVIPIRQDRESLDAKPSFTPIASQMQERESQLDLELQRLDASVLVLQAASKTLVESDFFRLGAKGNHIAGWASGILRGMQLIAQSSRIKLMFLPVIPVRDNTTLESLGLYYVLFTSDAAARAYMDNIRRLHTLSRTHGEGSMPFMPPPPESLRAGEDLKQVLRGFSLVPGRNRLAMHMVNKPYTQSLRHILADGGPPVLAEKRAAGGVTVLFSVDVGYISTSDVVTALAVDGRRRNLHWKYFGGKSLDITELRPDGYEGHIAFPHSRKKRFKTPPKFLLNLKDEHEARRFVREWHRRPLEVIGRDHDELGQESPAMVDAEVLW